MKGLLQHKEIWGQKSREKDGHGVTIATGQETWENYWKLHRKPSFLGKGDGGKGVDLGYKNAMLIWRKSFK